MRKSINKLSIINIIDNEINEVIRSVSSEIGLNRREAYIALYILILGSEYGPRIASIMNEIGKRITLEIYSKSL